MATIIVKTAEGNDFHFQNADNIASLFMKNHGISMPYELPIFGCEEYLDSVTILPNNMFEAKYIFNRLIVRIESCSSFEEDGMLNYCPQISINYNPMEDNWSDIDIYQSKIDLPRTVMETAGEVCAFLTKAHQQAWQ